MILPPQNRCVGTSQRQGVAIKHRTGTGGLDFIRQCFKISRAARSFWGSRHPSSGLALAVTQHPFPGNLRQLHCTVGVKFPFSVSKEVPFNGTAGSLPDYFPQLGVCYTPRSLGCNRKGLAESASHPAFCQVWGAESNSSYNISTVEPKSLPPGFQFYGLIESNPIPSSLSLDPTCASLRGSLSWRLRVREARHCLCT